MPLSPGESARPVPAAPPGGPMLAVARRLFQRMPLPPLRLVLWTGETLTNSADPPVATLRIRTRGALLRILLDPDMQFGDAFAAGQVELDGDLVAFLAAVFRAAPSRPAGVVRRLLPRRANSLAGSRRNINHHYDIGNDFYALWLDPQMLYTCAYYPAGAATLEQAQRAKMELICRKVQLRPGDRVIEAGCGWGGLACHMARQFGVRVRAFNISCEQIEFARRRAAVMGLADRVEFIEDDYRNITGRCDAFVSVGMLEHVGPEHYRELGAVMHRVLGPTGRGLIHTIGRHREIELSRWIAARIFPGANPPTLRQMMDLLEPFDFCATDVENLRLHYARTCGDWLRNFDAAADRVSSLFDERFVRAWRLYLAGSQAAFLAGSLQLFQVVFRRHADPTVPWTREHLRLSNLHGAAPCGDAMR